MFFKKKKNVEKKSDKEKVKVNLLYIFRVLIFIFIIIFVYVIINFYRIFKKSNIKVYEVNAGEIVNVDRHKGVIYRDESVVNCAKDGYINFFVTNAEKVNRGAFIYSINDTPNTSLKYELNDNDKNDIKKEIKKYSTNVTNLDFSDAYLFNVTIKNIIEEKNLVKELEHIDIEKEFTAKEKGYSKYAGLISFYIDGYEEEKIEDFSGQKVKSYDNFVFTTEKNKVKSGDKVCKIVKNPEFEIAFDSDYDYDNYKISKFVNVKFVYDNITAKGRISSFVGNDEKKHFKLSIVDYPEKFLDKRMVEFEIENRKLSGFKIPIKSIVSKNCFKIPKGMIEYDFETNENVFFKVGREGTKEKMSCNISKEDDKFYYISIDDILSKLKYGDVLMNRYSDTYSLSEVSKLDGVYNMNKGYAVFKNIEIIDKTNEYAIIKKNTLNGIMLYDHIALNSTDINEGDLIAE